MLPAFRKAVELREIDAQTCWSLAHMSAIYARFEDGEAAMQCLNNLAKSALTNSFFTLHNDWRKMNISLCIDPPIQLDAIMGYVNALQEMVMYVSEDLVKLLPALSAELQKGSIKDFRYVDGCIDMVWDMEQKNFAATLTSLREHDMYIQLPSELGEYQFLMEDCHIFKEGELYKLHMGEKGKLLIKTGF